MSGRGCGKGLLILIIVSLSLLFLPSVRAQDVTRDPPLVGDANDQLGAWGRQIGQLFETGRFAEAMEIAERARELAETKFGPDDSHVATFLYTLARLYHAQGRYAEAEPLYKRINVMVERVVGPDHPDLVSSELALLY
jgi:tetratricopeptide (TPR) repeat protein